MNIPQAPNHLLAQVPLFAHLSADVLEELIRSSRTRRYPQGQILCTEGDPGDHLIVLESGLLRISRFTAGGDEAVLAVVEAPAVVGELALLDGAPRDATVRAQRAVTVRLLPRSEFLDLIRREPMAVEGLFWTLAQLVRAGNARHADYVGLNVPGRLAKWLLRQAKRSQEDAVTMGAIVVLHSSQGDLAAELGTTRSTLNRALHDFEALGLIVLEGNRVIVQKPDALRWYSD